MKIGILTFHCAHNYGAVLQTFALQEFLKLHGHDVDVIDYRPGYLTQPYRVTYIPTSLKKLAGLLLHFPKKHKRYRRFNDFITRKLNLSAKSYIDGNFDEKYDAYVLGSDQIWNSKITNGDPVYFGVFNKRHGALLIAYAASTEVKNELESADLSPYKDELRKLTSISVREDALRDVVQPLVTTQVHTVLDPTLLVHTAVLENISSKPAVIESYLLDYQVVVDANAQSIANRISANKNIQKQITLRSTISRMDLLNKFSTASPEEFLGLFQNARFVVTTSFHGVAFSIAFKKQFVCVANKNRGNYRVSSLLKKLGLEDRIIYSQKDIPAQDIDYRAVYQVLEAERDASTRYLLDALKI